MLAVGSLFKLLWAVVVSLRVYSCAHLCYMLAYSYELSVVTLFLAILHSFVVFCSCLFRPHRFHLHPISSSVVLFTLQLSVCPSYLPSWIRVSFVPDFCSFQDFFFNQPSIKAYCLCMWVLTLLSHNKCSYWKTWNAPSVALLHLTGTDLCLGLSLINGNSLIKGKMHRQKTKRETQWCFSLICFCGNLTV